jgi:excisionase family DNA binding protein
MPKTMNPQPIPAEGGIPMSFFKVEEVARLLSVSRAKVYAMMDAGELAYAKFGKSRRVPQSAIESLVTRSMVGQ